MGLMTHFSLKGATKLFLGTTILLTYKSCILNSFFVDFFVFKNYCLIAHSYTLLEKNCKRFFIIIWVSCRLIKIT